MEKWTADDEPVVKLSSYLHLHELRSTLFGFVKIADGGEARGETLDDRLRYLHHRLREFVKKKGR